jgi:hypothetical protein
LFENENWLVQKALKEKPLCLEWLGLVVVGSVGAVDDPMDHHSQT